MKFAVLSDTHFLAESMLLPGARENMRLLNKINKDVFKELAAADGFDTVLITGDLTNSGDRDSHNEFIYMLREVRDSGKNVYVLTATHDFEFSRSWALKEGWAVKYKTHPWHKAWFDKDNFDYKSIVTDEFGSLSAGECVPPLVKPCTPEELWELYREFGRDQAFSVFEPDYSYCVKLDESTWCLMLNNNFRDIDPQENMSASYSPGCLNWIEGIVKQAREEGAFVFACTHHPLVPPVPAYKIGGTDRNMRKAYVGHMLADLGIPLVFSGHTHFSDIGFAQSDKGNLLCNVTTPSTCFLPPAYRIAELNDEKDRIKLTSIPVKKRDEYGVGESTMREYYEKSFIDEYSAKVDALPANLGKAVKGLKVKHLYPLCRCAGLTKEQYSAIKDMRMFDIIMQLVVNMQCGDGEYTPDTAVYRFMMGFAAAADSIIDTQPFIDLRKKLLGYKITEIIEPMLFNNGVPDGNAEFAFVELPEERYRTGQFRSRAGEILMAALCAFAVIISPVSPALTCTVLPALTIRKALKNKKNPVTPERY